MSIEALRRKETPFPFYSRKEAGEAVPRLYEETLALGQEEIRKLKEINELLHNPIVDKLVNEGKLTLGIIKPNAHRGRGLSSDDEKAASRLLDEIGREHIVFEFSSQLTQKQIETFYAGVKEKYSDVYDKPGDKNTIWEGVSELLKSGPVTFLLLYRNEGDAVTWWRDKMGKTHPAEADPESIRGRYGIEENMPNNLTHGSDSVEGVKKEISAVRGIISELTERSIEVANKFPTDQLLKKLGIISEEQGLVSVRRIFDSGMRSESWIYAYSIDYLDSQGNKQSTLLKEKNIISMGGALALLAEKRLGSFKEMEKLGINVPRTYGVVGATIYQDFIENDQTDEVYSNIRNNQLSENTKQHLDKLVTIAATLDNAGYRTFNFLNDFIFDGDKGEFYIIDFDFDTETRGSESSSFALSALKDKFRKHRQYIDQKYSETLDQLLID